MSGKELSTAIISAAMFACFAILSVYGFTVPEFSIELRASTYCFNGILKNIFCASMILWGFSMNTLLFIGLKVRLGSVVNLIDNKLFAGIVLGAFFLSSIMIVSSLFIAHGRCD